MVSRIIQVVEQWVTRIGLGLLMVMMLLVAVDVVLRYFLNRPIKGAFEITEMMMVAVVFLPLAYTMHSGGHISIEFVVERLPERVQAIIDSFTLTLALAFSALIVWQSTIQAGFALQKGETTDWLRISVFPARLLVPLGMFLLCLELVILLVRAVRIAAKGNAGETTESHATVSIPGQQER